MDCALAAIKQAASLSSGTEILCTHSSVYLLVSTYTKSLWLLRVKFLTMCDDSIHYSGSEALYSHNGEVEKMWILACCQVSRLVPVSI